VEKTITLEDDPIFRRAAHYNDKMNYPVTPPLEQRAAAVRDIILESVMLGRLDKTDLRIIAARDCSPMPNTRAVARQLHIPRRTRPPPYGPHPKPDNTGIFRRFPPMNGPFSPISGKGDGVQAKNLSIKNLPQSVPLHF